MYCENLLCYKRTKECQGHADAKMKTPLVPEGRYATYIKYCHEHVPGWQQLPIESLGLRSLLGGLSNELFVCQAKEGTAKLDIDTVVVRIYGPAMSILVDGKQERIVSRTLSKNNLGPKIYYEFDDDNGRIEEYLRGKPLFYTQLREREVNHGIVEYLAKFHAQDIEGISKDSQVFARMRRWLKLALQGMNVPSDWLGPVRTEHRRNLLEEMQFDGDRIEVEISWLEKYVKQFNSPVVFCHNDLQEGNVLREGDSGPFQVIDFEYGCYCERGFDLANFFCEWSIDNQYNQPPFFKIDHDYLPSLETRQDVIRHYLGEKKATDQEVQQVEREVYTFMLASHLQWVVWAVLQAFTPQVETNKFDYAQYAYERWTSYLRHKSSILG